MYKHIFLDFDDTLYDTRRNADEALVELYEHFGLSAHFEQYVQFSTLYWKRNHEVWALYSQGKIERQELMTERFLYPLRAVGTGDEAYALHLNDWFLEQTSRKGALVEGAMELLEYLHDSNYHLHIVSNGFTEVQYKKMRCAGIDHFFEQVILSEEVGVNKPDPRVFEFALAKAGATVENSLMIGDNYDTDIVGAMGSHIDQLFFNQSEAFVPNVAPTYEVRSLKEILTII